MGLQTRRRYLLGLAALGAAIGTQGRAEAIELEKYLGTWSGSLPFGASRLRFKLVIDSVTSARLFNVDQGGGEIRATHVELTAENATLEFAVWNARVVASLIGADELKGSWTWGNSAPLSIAFARGDLFAYAPLSNELLSEVRKESGAPAMSAAFARNGAEPTILADGFRSLDANVLATTEDVWCIGSVTKSMTATLVARLVETGKVTWEAKVGEILGASIPEMNDAYRTATLRNLLNHRAGLQREIDAKDYDTFALDEVDDAREERLRWAGLALSQAPAGPPGKAMLYANSGYVVAGAMVETVCGRPWEKLMQDYVFLPLGLQSAGFGAPGSPYRLDQPIGHSVSPTDPTKLIPAALGPGKVTATPIAKGPAGRVHVNMRDLIAFLNAHLRRPATFLRPETWATLHTPPAGSVYAMGWEVQQDGLLTHTGSNGFWWAHVAVDPRANVVAAAVANDGDAQSMAGAVGQVLQGALARARE